MRTPWLDLVVYIHDISNLNFEFQFLLEILEPIALSLGTLLVMYGSPQESTESDSGGWTLSMDRGRGGVADGTVQRLGNNNPWIIQVEHKSK